jgi:hypothetical protein
MTMHLQNRVTPFGEIVSAAGPTRRRHYADNALIVARVKASAADIKAADYVATGGVLGWPGAASGTMTNSGSARPLAV